MGNPNIHVWNHVVNTIMSLHRKSVFGHLGLKRAVTLWTMIKSECNAVTGLVAKYTHTLGKPNQYLVLAFQSRQEKHRIKSDKTYI